MKNIKTLGLAVLLSCLSLSTQAKSVVTVDDVYAQPNSRTYFTVNIKVDEDKADTYMSFDAVVTLPDGFIAPALVDGQKANNLTVWPDAMVMFGTSISAASQNPMPGTEINGLLSIDLMVRDVAVGDYNVTLSNIRVKSAAGEDHLDNATFTIHVTDVLTLDENSQVAPTELTTPSAIKVMRTIKANEWSTIVLPFDLTEEQVTEIFGEGTQLASFYDYSKTTDAETGDLTIDVEFVDAEPDEDGFLFYAGTPYIIKVTKDITELNLSDMVIEYLEIDDVDSKTTTGSGSRKKPIGKFIGTYVAKTVVPEKSLFLSNNKFNYSTGKTKMKAFRAYFTFNDIASVYDDAAAGARVNFFVKNGNGTTQIQIPELLNDGEYYDLNGLRVDTPSKGIYIKDGKKVVVK